jgi:arylsulfatase A-like enzyme/Flp pilus assembly protein TadD
VAVAFVLLLGAFLLIVKPFSDDSVGGGPQNILLITLDTTRADHLGCYGYAAAATPALDQLAAGGVLFDQAFSAVPMTLPSHATMLTGLLPPEHGLRVNGEHRLDLNDPTLTEILRERGYETGAFIAAFPLDSRNGLDRGFDTYDDDLSAAYEHHEGDLSAYRPGNVVTDSALTWLEKRSKDRPFFCWVHLFDPHQPYHPHDAEELAGTRYRGRASYDAEIAFMDSQVGRLTRFLKKEDLAANTLVVAVGDHGEGLDEHEESAHGYMLYETTLHVPLIFSLPGRIPEGLRVDTLVSLVDLFATIPDLLEVGEVDQRSGRSIAAAVYGHEMKSVSSYGETHLPFTTGNWSPLWSLTTGQWKYIRSARHHLYDRQADAKELNNLADARPDKVEEMEKELEGLEKEMAYHSAEQIESTADQIAILAALGYLSSDGKSFDETKMDYSSLRDVEDVLPVLKMISTMRDLGREGKYDEQISMLYKMLELSPESAGLRHQRATALSNLGKDQEALAEFLEYLKLKPDEYQVHRSVGILYHNQRDFPEAVGHFSRAIELMPDFAEAHEALAKILRDHGDPDGAARHSEGLWVIPDEAVAHYDLGVVLGAQKEFQEAIEHFHQALKIVPDDPLSHAGLARVLDQKGDLGEAARHYAEAARLDPTDAQRLCKLGTAYGKEGKFTEAIRYLTQALEIEPGNTSAHNNLGMVRIQQGKLPEAIEHFSRVLELQADNALAHRNLGDVYARQGKLAEAAREYSETVRLEPEDSLAHRGLGEVHLRQGRPSEAERHYSEAVRLDAEDAASHTGLGMALGMQRRFEEAIEHFSEVSRIDPEDAHAHFLRGGMLEAQKQAWEAAAAYRASLLLDPNQVQVANALAWLLATHPDEKIRNGAEAVELSEWATGARGREDPMLLDTLAAAYAETGRLKEAAATARKAVESARGAGNEELAEELEGRLKLYEAGQSYRQTAP